MPQCLVRIQPSRPDMLTDSTPREDRIVEARFAYLKALPDRGGVLLAGRTLNSEATSFGIVLLTAPSDAAAPKMVNRDPAVSAGVFRAEFFPHHVALASERMAIAAPMLPIMRSYGTAGPS